MFVEVVLKRGCGIVSHPFDPISTGAQTDLGRPIRESLEMSARAGDFPIGFFDRADSAPDPFFYAPPRLVTHIDEGAVAAVGDLYEELGLDGSVLDIMSSWVSHFRSVPSDLTVLGMNADELQRNRQAKTWLVHDLNVDPRLPFEPESFDAVVCCVSVDYLIRPVEVFADVARVVRPGGHFVCTFSNRCFPTKAIRGWLQADDAGRCALVSRYFALSGLWAPAVAEKRPTPQWGDPLYAVWSTRPS
jgi:SAM-dependent methyltransferase